MNSLPPELLTRIFRATDDITMQMPIRCSHVSRRWRAAALADPALWSNLSPAAMRLKWEALELLLERTRQAPVVLNPVVVDENNIDLVTILLQKHLHHIQILSLLFRPELGNPDASAPILECLCLPAPMMTRIFIINGRFELPRQLLGGSAQNLKSLSIGELVTLPSDCPALQSVSSLESYIGDQLHGQVCLTQLMPRLAFIVLVCASRYTTRYRLDLGHKLERLVLELFSSDPGFEDPDSLFIDMRPFLTALNHASCGHIVCGSSHKETISVLFDGIPDAQTMTVTHINDEVRFDLGIGEAVEVLAELSLTSADGARSRKISYVDTDVLDTVLTNRTMNNITTVRCAHHHLHIDPPHMPQLATLIVDFVSPAYDLAYDQLAAWVDEERAPLLAVVHLIKGLPPDEDEELSALNGQALVTALGTRESSPIIKLVVSGLEMEDADEGYAALEAAVESLTWE
ncbi:hypothetical protein EXIGLDRAFT_723173 [Exidia glandulosa HHB12029]|uniref:F-box domain-containing protein n=1 Tax=Exidia glandulosa HHB12029 TaxID=1314781 RepID=A0A165N085_EXIGL|nr:hypothetical protein EXIGLDRAFT_723173 [Exidia glandulosa HHB12029]